MRHHSERSWLPGSRSLARLVALGIFAAVSLSANGGAFFRLPSSYALVIGLDLYPEEDAPLPVSVTAASNPVATSERLASLGYRVTTLTNEQATRAGILTALRRLALGTGPQDIVILYLSGIAVRNSSDGRLYWLTYDTRLRLLEAQAFRLDHLQDLVNDIPSRHKLILIDGLLGGEVIKTAFLESRGRFEIDINEPVKLGNFENEIGVSDTGTTLLATLRSPSFSDSTPASLTSLTLEALEGGGDVDKDGELSVMELKSFLEAGLVPPTGGQLKAFLHHVDKDWRIAKLPTPGGRNSLAAYKETLAEWRSKGWLSIKAFIEINKLLEDRQPTTEEPNPGVGGQERLLNQILQVIDSPARGPSQARTIERLLSEDR